MVAWWHANSFQILNFGTSWLLPALRFQVWKRGVMISMIWKLTVEKLKDYCVMQNWYDPAKETESQKWIKPDKVMACLQASLSPVARSIYKYSLGLTEENQKNPHLVLAALIEFYGASIGVSGDWQKFLCLMQEESESGNKDLHPRCTVRVRKFCWAHALPQHTFLVLVEDKCGPLPTWWKTLPCNGGPLQWLFWIGLSKKYNSQCRYTSYETKFCPSWHPGWLHQFDSHEFRLGLRLQPCKVLSLLQPW